MKLVIFLNGMRGVQVIKRLLKENVNILLLVTSPDRLENLLRLLEQQQIDLNVVSSENINSIEMREQLEAIAADAFIVAGFSQILGQAGNMAIDAVPITSCLELQT